VTVVVREEVLVSVVLRHLRVRTAALIDTWLYEVSAKIRT